MLGCRIGIFSYYVPYRENNLVLWLDALAKSTRFSDLAGTILQTSGSGNIGCWKDKTGNGNNAVASTTNTRPYLNPNAINRYTTVAFQPAVSMKLVVTLTSPITTNTLTVIYVTIKQFDNISKSIVSMVKITDINDTLVSSCIFGYEPDPSTLQPYRAGTFKSSTNPPVGTAYVRSLVFTGSACYSYVNGVLSNIGSDSGDASSNFNSNSIMIGCRWYNSTHSYFYNGSLGEIIIYNTALSDENRQKIEAYLINKWGIVL